MLKITASNQHDAVVFFLSRPINDNPTIYCGIYFNSPISTSYLRTPCIYAAVVVLDWLVSDIVISQSYVPKFWKQMWSTYPFILFIIGILFLSLNNLNSTGLRVERRKPKIRISNQKWNAKIVKIMQDTDIGLPGAIWREQTTLRFAWRRYSVNISSAILCYTSSAASSLTDTRHLKQRVNNNSG